MQSQRLCELEQAVQRAWPAGSWGEVRVVVAVSGGADSVALLQAMARLARSGSGALVVGHFNHRLRGAVSDDDAGFVAELAAKLELPCEMADSRQFPLAEPADGIEAAAREARYRFLRQTAARLGARYLVTAHTADDQAETVLHHVLRGSGLAGLAGVPAVRVLSPAVTLVRPLLHVTRHQVLSYLEQLGQPYRHDATNADCSLLRNRIRHELLPLLERDYVPGVRDALVRLAGLAADAQQTIQQAAERQLDAALERADTRGAAINCPKLDARDRHLVREALVVLWRRLEWPRQSMGFDEWEALSGLAMAGTTEEPPAITLPGAIRAHRAGEQLVLTRLS